MNIDTGDKVVCIDDTFDASVLHLFTALPVKGRVYSVRDVQIGFTPILKRRRREGAVRLLLVGLNNPLAEDGKEHGFNSDRFRRLDEVQAVNAHANVIQLPDLIGKDIKAFAA